MMRSTALFRLLSVSGLCYLTLSISPPQYHYISLQMNYSQSQTYCRDIYTDLATIYNSGDLDRLVQLVPNGTANVWIGLEFGDEFEWHWSLPDQRKIEFFNWRAAEPKQNNTQDSCAAMDPNGQITAKSKEVLFALMVSNPTSILFIAISTPYQIQTRADSRMICLDGQSDIFCTP
ncbi:unnamed protein product, partial [Oncorhynchus mykiss]